MFRRLCLAILVGSALVGCGGDDEPDPPAPDEPPAYYSDLADLTAEVDAEDTAADEALGDALPTTDPSDVGDLFSAATRESADRLDATLEQMASLTPPEAAVAAHEELVAATRAEQDASRQLAGRLAGLGQAQLEALPPPPGLMAAEARTDAACLALQELADEADAGVRLCVGMFAEPAGG